MYINELNSCDGSWAGSLFNSATLKRFYVICEGYNGYKWLSLYMIWLLGSARNVEGIGMEHRHITCNNLLLILLYRHIYLQFIDAKSSMQSHYQIRDTSAFACLSTTITTCACCIYNTTYYLQPTKIKTMLVPLV